jgi:hypothetical protein
MKDTVIYLTVTMHINISKFYPTKDRWDVKFERDIIQHISVPTFAFSSTSMNVAITKVADLVARHPENYFKEINIK